ncbi:MAG TPA: arsenate reductase (azurin) small subunit [Burkholderiales bacterium]|jgi:arsenite oxidase small subunit|nr:arsenate reductase (azurin) small subunit [Burkholderiales bacterium]
MSAQLSRRSFLKLGAGAVASGTVATVATGANAAPTDTSKTILPYPRKVVGVANRMAVNTPVAFSYPDAASPCAVVKLGKSVPGGVGPEADIVAYSTLCTHMGCPVSYDAANRVFKCGCHYSIFDAEKDGQMVCGQATENLPRVALEYDETTGRISAVGMEGLIYGRQANVL